MRESGESVGFMEQSGINHTVSPLGREAAIIDNIGKADTLPTEGFYD